MCKHSAQNLWPHGCMNVYCSPYYRLQHDTFHAKYHPSGESERWFFSASSFAFVSISMRIFPAVQRLGQKCNDWYEKHATIQPNYQALAPLSHSIVIDLVVTFATTPDGPPHCKSQLNGSWPHLGLTACLQLNRRVRKLLSEVKSSSTGSFWKELG